MSPKKLAPTYRDARGRRISPANAVVRAVEDVLALRKIWYRRLNSRTVLLPGAGGRERPVYFGSLGMADILATPWVPFAGVARPVLLWIECKSGTGRQSDAQRAFEAQVVAAGHFYLVAHDSADEVENWLRSSEARGNP